MGKDAGIRAEIRTIIAAALRGALTEASARRAFALGEDATLAVMLAANGHIAELTAASVSAPGVHPALGVGPHTPSGAIPPYAKGPTGKRRRKRLGARDGHEGHRRASPIPDRVETIEEMKSAPSAGVRCRRCGPIAGVHAPSRTSRRMSRSRPSSTASRSSGAHPPILQEERGAGRGNGVVALTTVMHYGLGLTIDQTREIFASHLRTPLSAGGLVDLWRRAGEALSPWYEQIGREAKASATPHADETGWRVNGDTHWLWCFCNQGGGVNCYYLIDESRGSGVLKAFFAGAFAGVLMSDFFAAYQSVVLGPSADGVPEGARQCCPAHLLRELDHVDKDVLGHKSPDGAKEWNAFVKMLRRLLHDGIRLRKRPGFVAGRTDAHASKIRLIDKRLIALAGGGGGEYDDPDTKRLANRLSRYRDELFTFLDRPEADGNNTFAERQVRPAVILRKNSQCNRSERGDATQAILMSIHRTLTLRGLDPRAEIENALQTCAATGILPPLPLPVVAGG